SHKCTCSWVQTPSVQKNAPSGLRMTTKVRPPWSKRIKSSGSMSFVPQTRIHVRMGSGSRRSGSTRHRRRVALVGRHVALDLRFELGHVLSAGHQVRDVFAALL